MEQLLLSTAEAARFIGVGRTTLYELINRGAIRTVKVGRRRLVPRSALEDFVRRLEVGCEEATA